MQFGDNGNRSQGADRLRLFTQGLVLLFISVVYGAVVLLLGVAGGGQNTAGFLVDAVNGPRHPTTLIRLNSGWKIRQSRTAQYGRPPWPYCESLA